MTWMLTSTGKRFDFAAPSLDQIDIKDIAMGLSRECRYAGQCSTFYSVAQHSVLASHLVTHEFALEALLHDAAEAYVRDIPAPLKGLLPDYARVERRVDSFIRFKFALPTKMSPEVKLVDLRLLATEKARLFPYDTSDWGLDGVEPYPFLDPCYCPTTPYKAFMRRFGELTKT